MFLVWQDRRNGVHYDLFVQRLNAAGNALFTSNGLAVCNATGDQQWPVIVPDASGGAFIIWWDQRGDPSYPDLYAQHINSIGFGTWTPNGVAVCTDVSFAVTSFDIAPDGSGGAIAVWSDERNGASNADVFAQRVDASGSALWTPNGRSVCVATADQQRTRVVTDGSGGAILVWDDQRDGNYDIYAQRVNASGSALWTADGVPLYANTNNQVDARLIPDGSGGAIAVWDDGRSGLTFDIYAQRVDASGASLWTAGGVAVCTGSSAAQTYSQIVPDGAGGALIAWQDARSVTTWDAYAQRLDAAGNVLWTTNGVPVSIGAGHQENVAVVSDSSGGAIVAWQDTRPGFYDVYAQRVDASGSALWAANGVAVSNVVANKRTPVILSDNSGGAFLAWADWRTGGNSADIYAQRIDRAGRWVFASPPQISALRDIPNDQGGAILLQWARSELDALPDALITHYSAWRRLPQLAAGPVAAGAPLVDPIDIPADFSGPAVRAASGYSWQWLGNVPAQYFDSYALTVPSLYDSTGSNPGWQYFMVTAHAGSPAPFCDSAIDSGYSVDNLSPAAPQGLAGSPESSSEGLRLTWNASLESDREHYAVYRGPSPAFVPSPASLVASPRDTTWFDALWRGD
ncbi:MAG: hypothetical protein OEO21_12315, partial [Candidatus Krumholzibacteria bacterium]|nr:hypothetical protein [Candidatus Krumholzibacteria bacterium]